MKPSTLLNRINSISQRRGLKLMIGRMHNHGFFLALAFLFPAVLGAQTTGRQSSPITAPLTLQQAVAFALDNNPLLKTATEALTAAQAKVPQAVSHYLPQVNFDETFTRSNNPIYVFGSRLTQRQFGPQNFAIASLNKPDALDNFQAQLSVQQVIYDAGKIRGAISQARLGQKVAEQEVEKNRQELIFRVVKAYTQHLLAGAEQRVAQDAVKTARAAYEHAEARYQSGMTVESDKLASHVYLARMQEMRLQAENQVALSKANLNFEMGLPLDLSYELASQLKEARYLSEPTESLWTRALEQRPDYLQTLFIKDIAQKSVGVARAEFLPHIGLFGTWEADSQMFTRRGGNNWTVGAQLHFNLFRGRGDEAKLAEAKANLERSRFMNAYVSSAVKLQIKQTLLELNTTRQRIEVTQSAAAQAEESLRITQNRYNAGLTTITDLLRAQTDLTQARTAYLQALYDHRIAKANLELASGTLNEKSEALHP